MMLHYFREAHEGETLHVTCRLLEHDDKRMRVWLEMAKTKGGEAIAASEQLLLSVLQQESGARAALWRAETKAALDAARQGAGRRAASAPGRPGHRAEAQDRLERARPYPTTPSASSRMAKASSKASRGMVSGGQRVATSPPPILKLKPRSRQA